ncbi:MAG: hypothetical protein KBD64_07945, partial [Gammaproteobacteria bacterium]|nr:hypothetical protein [Gammaproteobacteria bacterium]
MLLIKIWLRIKTKLPKYSRSAWIANFLFWPGALASAMQGYFSIGAFISTLGTIPGLTFLALIPYPVIFILATLSFYYVIFVEQQIFRKFFTNLIRQLFKDTQDKDYQDTFNTQYLKLRAKLKALINPSSTSPSSIKNPASTRVPKRKSLPKMLFYRLRLFFGYCVAFVIVSLRAIVSIASTMLGLKTILLLAASMFLITTLPGYIVLICAILAGVGYVVKNSQNLLCQFNETLKLLGFKRFIRKDVEKQHKVYKQILKESFREDKQATHLLSTVKSLSESKPKLSWWKSITNQLLDRDKPDRKWWQVVIARIFDFGFIIGAIGASMTGFFSIEKFVSQISSISFLSFFAVIPGSVIIAAACTIAVYTLFVEQKILYNFFSKLVGPIIDKLNFGRSKESSPNTASSEKKKTQSPAEKIQKKQKSIANIYAHPYMKSIAREPNLVLVPNDLTGPKDKKYIDILQVKLDTPVKKYSKLRLILSIIGTVFILVLRGITNVGPSTLGLVAAIKFIALAAFSVSLGPWIFAFCAAMAICGYLIKCSQNLTETYYGTLEDMFGIR